MDTAITLDVDGQTHRVTVDTRTTLLDALRERLDNTSPKKGCDHGQCGSCTVLLDGRRHLTCLALAVAHDGARIRTAAGLTSIPDGAPDDAPDDGHDTELTPELHPVQQAFLDHDAYQCGYCTPGQICSAVGMLEEAAKGHPSHVTRDLSAPDVELTDEEIRERMSGNLCRCGAYRGILDAVRASATTP